MLGGTTTNADRVVSDGFPFYEPTDLTIRLNKEVTFTVFNAGSKIHNITIPGFVIDMDVAAGQTISVKLPATAAAPRDGFFRMYCQYHQSVGYTGRISIPK